MKFRDLPIRRKLITIISLAAGLGLLLNLIFFTAADLRAKRNSLESQLKGLAQIVAQNSVAAIRFDDPGAAMTTLAGLAARPEVVSARITLSNGRVFAQYLSVRADPQVAAASDQSLAKVVAPGEFQITQPVGQDGELMGEVSLQAKLSDAWGDTLATLVLASGTSLLAFAAAMVMALRLQRSISLPLMQLSAMADAVAADGNHDRRLVLDQSDEIGELANRFNAMLVELQAREHELQLSRDRLEDQVEQRTAQLKIAKDVAEFASLAKTRFLANMSHELRTPLNAVIGAAQLLKAGTGVSDVESQTQMVDAIQKSGTNLLALIENILDLSRIEVGELRLTSEDFHLVDCIESALATASLTARAKGLTLSCIVMPAVPNWRNGDANRLRQVLLNLLGNAVKFTQQGDIVLRVERGASIAELHISLTDTGVGIGQSSLPHIFEPFRQADDAASRRFGGSGLGLSIVHQLVNAMGGHIQAQSELGQGTRFDVWLSLPLASAPPAPLQPMNLPIAWFEPHEPSAQALAAQLEQLGCQAQPVHTSEELVSWLKRQSAHGAAPWLLINCDAPMATGLLEGALDELDPEHVIGMTSHEWVEGGLARDTLKLPRTLTKPVLRSALVSRLSPARATPFQNGVPKAVVEPVRSADSVALVATAAVGDFGVHDGVHILVVEDDLLNQTIVRRLLSHAGYMSTAANDGNQALALVAERPFDLVLMDWQMPGMDGLEVTRRMRLGEAGPAGTTVPIVALTANAFAEDREACLAAGMDDFLTKPVLADRLIAAVQRWGHKAMAPLAPATTQSADSERRNVPVFDPSVLAALPMVADGSDPGYGQELMAMFINSTQGVLNDINSALAAQDLPKLQRVVHSLKSSSAMVGAMELSSLAALHETRLRQGLPPAPELPQLFLQAVRRLQIGLKQGERV